MRPSRNAVFVACCFLLAGCSEPQLTSIQGFAQGTTYTVSYWSDEGIPAEQVKAQAEQTLQKIDQELSNYRDDSDIETFNRSDATAPQAVPGSMVELVRIAEEIHGISQGCYDLTIRPLFDLWGFGDEFHVPTVAEVQTALSAVGMDKLTVIDDAHLAKSEPGLAVDVSSIAQGYSTGEIARALEAMNITDYLVEVGGELLVNGGKPDGEPWRVAIERPLAGERRIHKIIEIVPNGPMSVVTSGTYRHYYDEDNRRYSHILDARTGAPVEHDLLSVTVFHPDPTLADAWSTALLCLGTEPALRTATEQGLAVMLIEANGEGWKESFSPAFSKGPWQVQDASTGSEGQR